MATTTLAEIQTQLLAILSPQGGPPPSSGHSLESDLKALRIFHLLCIDTALICQHSRGRPLILGLAGLVRNCVTTRSRYAARADTTPKKTRVPALTCFGSKSKAEPDSASSRPTMRPSLSAWRGRAAGVARALRELLSWTIAIQA